MQDLTSAKTLADSTYTNGNRLTTLKKCRRCSRWRPRSCFHRMPTSADRLQYHCRDCGRELQAERARDKGTTPRKRQHPDNLASGVKECFSCSTVKPLADYSPSKRGYGGVSTYCKPCNSAKRIADPAFHAARTRAYRSGNLKYRQAHAAHMAKRRCRKREQDTGLVTTEFIRSIYAELFCYYCRERIDVSKRTIEHKQPIVLGGLHHPENLVMACQHCNSSKQDMTEAEYVEKVRANV